MSQPTYEPKRHCGRVIGFTLIELLVVIAIISLLIAMLLPALSSAQMAAMHVQCISDIRQLQMSLTMYGSEYRESLPWARDKGNNGNDRYWPQMLVRGRYTSSPTPHWSAIHRQHTAMVLNQIGDQTYHMPRVKALLDGTGTHRDAYRFSSYGVNVYGAMPILGDGRGAPRRLDGTVQEVFPPGPNNGYGASHSASPSNIMTIVGRGPMWSLHSYISGSPGAEMLSFNGSIPRVYLDGHASGGNGADLLVQPTGTYTSIPFTTNPYIAAEPWVCMKD